MIRIKRCLALVLATLMLLSLAACTGNGKTDVTEPQGEGVDSWLHTDGESLPLVAEGVDRTLHIMLLIANEWPLNVENRWLTAFVEQGMNINCDFHVITPNNRNEQLALAFAGGQLPDVIIGASLTTTELVRYGVQQEQIIDLAPYINEKYAPNLTKIYNMFPTFKEKISDSEGRIWSLGSIMCDTISGEFWRFFINYDVLDEQGLEAPHTLDEFTDMLRALKKSGKYEHPLGGLYATHNPMRYILNAFGYLVDNQSNGYNAKGLTVVLRDGTPIMPCADREVWPAVIKYMRTLYEEGLIEPEFFTMSTDTCVANMRLGKYVVFGQAPFVYNLDPTSWWGAPPLTSEYQDVPEVACQLNAISTGNFVVTEACRYPELAVAFIDYFYNMTENSFENHENISHNGPIQGSPLLDLIEWDGMAENEWRYVDENGVIQQGDLGDWESDHVRTHSIIMWWDYSMLGCSELTSDGSCDTNNLYDMSFLANSKKTGDLRKSDVFYKDGVLDNEYQFRAAMDDVARPYVTTEVFPNVVFFDEDTSDRLTDLYSAFRGYVEMETANFITGRKSLDKMDEYFDKLEELGAYEYIQAYVDYYESRK